MTAEPHYVYVEDDIKSREVMQLMMNRVIKHCTLTIFPDGIDFLDRLKALTTPPTLILLDIHMQPFDGFALLNLLRTDPAYRTTPVVALTASVMNEEVEKLRESGFNGVIGKPVSPHSFPNLLTQILDGESVWNVAN
ncbi:MAG: response regulator [Chloroflexota bacterium]|nr:response regulator [Chloroflexota bacterium]